MAEASLSWAFLVPSEPIQLRPCKDKWELHLCPSIIAVNLLSVGYAVALGDNLGGSHNSSIPSFFLLLTILLIVVKQP